MFKKLALIFSAALLMVDSFAMGEKITRQSNASLNPVKKSLTINKMAGPCEVEVVNLSREIIKVYGTYDDGMPLRPFFIYPNGPSVPIDLYYNGGCHDYIYIRVDSPSRNAVYANYLARGATLTIEDAWGWGPNPYY